MTDTTAATPTVAAAEGMTRKDIEALIIKRAWIDDGFKAEFLADPKATLEKYSEQSMPENVTIIAHEEDENSVHIVIPAKPKANDELSEDDLEKVAGGIDVVMGAAILGVIGASIGLAAAGIGAAGTAATIANQQTQRRHGW